MPEITEKFSWFQKEAFNFEPIGKTKVRIKGKAAFGNVISKNHRHYVDEELKRAARTWINKPINVNHDDKKVVGHIEWMEYDEDGLMEYIGLVDREPFNTLIRTNSPQIKGVSMQAGYLYNICPRCKKKFITEEEFAAHMKQEEFMLNFNYEPHGVQGNAMALVVGDEVPGIDTTSVEIMETYQLPQLMEMVTKTEMEKENYMNNIKNAGVALQENRRQEKTNEPFSQPQIEKAKEEIHREITKPSEIKENLKIAEPCSPELIACKQAILRDHPEYDEGQAIAMCRAKGIEMKLPNPLEIQQPLREFKTVEDAPTIREGATDALRYHEESVYRKQVAETVNKLLEELNHFEKIVKTKVIELFTDISRIPKDDNSWAQKISELQTIIANIPKDDLGWKQQFEQLPKDDLSWKEFIANLPKDDVSWKQENKALKESVDKEFKEIMAKVDEKLKEFDKILCIADTNNIQKDEKIAELERKLKEKEDNKVKETTEKDIKIKELEDANKKLEEQLETVKPNFKGKTKGVTASQNAPLLKDPMKGD
jgi:hypothetical protein